MAQWEIPNYQAERSLLPRGMARELRSKDRERLRLAKQFLQNAQSYGTYFTTMTQTGAENINGQGLTRPFTSVPFSTLRAIAALCQIDVLIIGALKAAARRFARICYVPEKQLGFRVVHKRYDDPHFQSDTEDIVRRCAEMERILENPTFPVHASFEDFLMNAINEQLVLDRRCLVLPRDRAGRVASFHLVDGATVRPRVEVLAQWMVELGQPDPEQAMYAMQAKVWNQPPISTLTGLPQYLDLTNAAYVQVIEGRVTDAWTQEQMEVGIANPTVQIDHWGYGISPLEATLPLSLLFMKVFRFNSNLFDVNFPEAALILSGDYDEEGLEGFRRAAMEYEESEASLRLPVISGDENVRANLLQLRETPHDMLMGEMINLIIRLKCAAYRVDPSMVNVEQSSGAGGTTMNIGVSEDAAFQASRQDGFHSLMMSQADFLTRAVVAKRYDDLMVIVEGLDVENPEFQLKRDEFDLSWMPFNDFLVKKGKKKLPKDLPKELGDFVIGSTGFLQAYNALAQVKMQEDQANMQNYEQGDFGQGQSGNGGQEQTGGDEQPTQEGWQQGQQESNEANPEQAQRQGPANAPGAGNQPPQQAPPQQPSGQPPQR